MSFPLLVALLLSGFGLGTLTFPATVEVDLVFPRNDTYAPDPLLPIVFAIQHSNYAPYINPSIQFSITSDTNVSDGIFSSFMDFSSANLSSSDPYFGWDAISKLNGIDGRWRLAWSLFTNNCSTYPEAVSPNITSQDKENRIVFTNSIVFTTRNGTQQPDLIAASANSVCAGTNESFTFNVTGTVDVWNTENLDGRNSCAILSPVAPTTNPCVTIRDMSAHQSKFS
ncbi:hypothetical protein ZTR_09217 [Talaromyces verruculosus]|nr:hypothetical protein ZTR_09217 [Talaromyces verruculosus]